MTVTGTYARERCTVCLCVQQEVHLRRRTSREKPPSILDRGTRMNPRRSRTRSEMVFGTAGAGITNLRRGVEVVGVRSLIGVGRASARLTSAAEVRIGPIRCRLLSEQELARM